MTYEYTQLTHPEAVYGKKNLLYSQMNLLMGLKRLEEYKKLREEELVLKIKLKKKLKEAHEALSMLNKALPITKDEAESAKEIKIAEKGKKSEEYGLEELESAAAKKSKRAKSEKKQKSRSSLDKELDDIKGKLAALQE